MNSFKNNTINIGIVGVGTVGGGAVTILARNSELIANRLTQIRLARIADKDMQRAKKLVSDLGLQDVIISDDWHDLITDPAISIIIEVVGGINLPLEIISTALKNGKSVVTANKDLISSHGDELLDLAEENGVDLLFEAAVAGGIPIIQVVKESLAADKINSIMGIVNGTTNYILTAMSENNLPFDVALKQAQDLGYAEADPTSDIEGLDAARKIAILASVAFNSRVKDKQVPVEGITKISQWDIQYAKEFGYTIKMLGIAKCDSKQIEVRVHPALIPATHPLATVRDSFNAVYIESDDVDKAMFTGRGAGALPTGSAIMGDVINAARNICLNTRGRINCTCFASYPIKALDDTVSQYYIRINAKDAAGVFAAIAKSLGNEDVSIASAMQKRWISEHNAEIVVITHAVRHADFMRAVEQIGKLECVEAVENIIRVEE